ncbi:MAG TPA: 4Fe-4S binding protein, partial [Syntrophorhabdaceae bacterium]|nr:4Fe-4S binding protein [Syntrophorhabdaceae bacterium]
NVPVLLQTISDALDYLEDESAVPAVIIARRECALLSKAGLKDTVGDLRIEELCTGCRSCLKNFNCPAMPFDEVKKRVVLDKGLCIKCGTCLYACPVQEKGKALKNMGKGYKVQGTG